MQFSLKCKRDLFLFKASETKITLWDLVLIKTTHQTMYVSITKRIPCLLNWGFCGDSLKLIDLITFDRFGSSNKCQTGNTGLYIIVIIFNTCVNYCTQYIVQLMSPCCCCFFISKNSKTATKKLIMIMAELVMNRVHITLFTYYLNTNFFHYFVFLFGFLLLFGQAQGTEILDKFKEIMVWDSFTMLNTCLKG